MSNYTVKITCPLSLERIYDAITKHMSDWWTPMSAPFLKVGDIAKTDFGGEAYWVFESTTLKHPSLIELTCLESNFLHPTMGGRHTREEWLNTTLKFELQKDQNGTVIHFTHIGLTPELECYEICKGGWDHYIIGSLSRYLNGKNATPNTY